MAGKKKKKNGQGGGGEKDFGARQNGASVVPKGTLRAPVSPFQTTVWRYVGKGKVVVVGRTGGNRTKKRERWKKRRRGGEQTDKHRRPQARHASECKPPHITLARHRPVTDPLPASPFTG